MDTLSWVLVSILMISLFGNWVLFLLWDFEKYRYKSSKKVYEEIIEKWHNAYKH